MPSYLGNTIMAGIDTMGQTGTTGKYNCTVLVHEDSETRPLRASGPLACPSTPQCHTTQDSRTSHIRATHSVRPCASITHTHARTALACLLIHE